jgi:hypothetical protein
MAGYAGSIALDPVRGQVAITSPKGGRVQSFALDGSLAADIGRTDVCGIGAGPDGFVVTDGLGGIAGIRAGRFTPLGYRDRAWDNHLVSIRQEAN